MPINFYNCPEPQEFDAGLLPKELPLFLSYVPDFDLIKKTAEKYKQYKNIIVIGHGGSVSSLQALLRNTPRPSPVIPEATSEALGARAVRDPVESNDGLESEYVTKTKDMDPGIPAAAQSGVLVESGMTDKKASSTKWTPEGIRVKFLSTIDPSYIVELKANFQPDDTLVIAISKSGEDITQIEALSQFWDFPILFITEKDTPLYQIAQKKNLDIFLHPEIGGRFTGLTEVALVPLAICGLDIEKIFTGGRALQNKFNQDNEAWKLASILFQLENEDFTDVFVPIYSHSLFNFAPLITQLAHETYGKDGKGQTFFVTEGPEWQHHTLQRFLDGRKNAAGIFVSGGGAVSSSSADTYRKTKSNYQEDIKGVTIKNSTLEQVGNLHLQNSLVIEREATLEHAKDLKIPVMDLRLSFNGTAFGESEFVSEAAGEFIAFWQMFAVYSAILRNVNPFDQPAVEWSKKEAFKRRTEIQKVDKV